MKTPILSAGTATYCPEDNKLRLYVGRIPRDEYERLRSEGWTSTPKQGCDFVATWTPERRNTALEFAELIEDEDQGAEDRAADRAERFGEYRDKRTDEATGHADRYESGPSAHGYQNQQRAERAAARHDRIADRAGDAWSKAEYWQRRTAGVISHALYKSSPSVRMGRIKVIESEIRKAEKTREDYILTRERWLLCAAITDDADKQNHLALQLAYVEHGDYTHPRTGRKSYLYDLGRHDDGEREPDTLTGAELCALFLSRHGPLAGEGPWLTHYRLRLAYENQMLEAQGGRLASVEIEPGGYIGGKLILKVNKSSVTGRVTSVDLKGPQVQGWVYQVRNVPGTDYAAHQFDTERMPMSAYTAPTDESRAELAALKAEKKAKAPAKIVCPLINPTDADAERLQTLWNEKAMAERVASYQRQSYSGPVTDCEPVTVLRITQAAYSEHSKGTYASASTRGVFAGGEMAENYRRRLEDQMAKYGRPVCQIRRSSGGNYQASRVIVLTDKPQKPLPAAVWSLPTPEAPAFALEMEAAK